MVYNLIITLSLLLCVSAQYEPNWDSLDTRPLPGWYDQAKIGIFIHWGVFSVPSFGGKIPKHASEWFWQNWKGRAYPEFVAFMDNNYRPGFTYADFAKDFTAEFYDPVYWANLFQNAGAKYVVFVTKHHDGFCNYPTKYSPNWNSVDLGPNRDLLGDFVTAVKENTDLKLGLYHSLYEWFHPLYIRDKANGHATQDFVFTKTLPELYELVNTYHPEIVWSDGDWEAPDTYWNSTTFLAWLYNSSPTKDTVVVNDRWGKGVRGHHGDFFNFDDRYNPGVLQEHKWENAFTLEYNNWGHTRPSTLSTYMPIHEMISIVSAVMSTGGNVLINVGPSKDGMIPPIQEERLLQLGEWLGVNGEAIYSSVPWVKQNDTLNKDVWYTSGKDGEETVVYAIVLNWPEADTLVLGDPIPDESTKVTMLGYEGGELQWSSGGNSMSITFPNQQNIASKYAWTLRFTLLQNREIGKRGRGGQYAQIG